MGVVRVRLGAPSFQPVIDALTGREFLPGRIATLPRRGQFVSDSLGDPPRLSAEVADQGRPAEVAEEPQPVGGRRLTHHQRRAIAVKDLEVAHQRLQISVEARRGDDGVRVQPAAVRQDDLVSVE